MFYQVFEQLCREKGVTSSRACTEMGLSRSVAAKWKSTKTQPSADVLLRISKYFGVSIDYLLGADPEGAGAPEPRQAADEEIKFALFGGTAEITDEMYEEVKRFAQFVKEREHREHGK